MENYIIFKGSKLCKAIVFENYLMDNIQRYRDTTDPVMKEQIAMGMQATLWFLLPYNVQRVIQISSNFWDTFLKDPNITISFNHIERRKDVMIRLFETYNYYNWKGDGRTIEQIINEFQFNILTSSENASNYQGEIKLSPISVEMVRQIMKYQRYWRKGWFQTRPLKNYDEIKKIPLKGRFCKEIDLIESMGLEN